MGSFIYKVVLSFTCGSAIFASCALAEVREDAVLYLDFSDEATLAGGKLSYQRIEHAAKKPLEFSDPLQVVELPGNAVAKLHAAKSATVGGWFLLRRAGEQTFFS